MEPNECPNCGAPAKTFKSGKFWVARCTACGLQIARRSKEEVVEAWNARAYARVEDILEKVNEVLTWMQRKDSEKSSPPSTGE